jgi:hypothetical protein
VGTYLELVPVEIHEHIRTIARVSNLPQTEEAVDLVARGWLERKSSFERIIDRMELREVKLLERTDSRGCLAMTVSGSLVTVGPLRRRGRTVHYTSIGLRHDVPRWVTHIGSELDADVVVGAPVRFTAGPIASSSSVLKIAVTSEEIDLEEQERLVARAKREVTRELIEIGRELEVGEG